MTTQQASAASVAARQFPITFSLVKKWNEHECTRCGLVINDEELEFSMDTEYDMGGICLGRYIEKNFQQELLTLNYDECVYACRVVTEEGEKVLVYGAYGWFAMEGLLYQLKYWVEKISEKIIDGNSVLVFSINKFYTK